MLLKFTCFFSRRATSTPHIPFIRTVSHLFFSIGELVSTVFHTSQVSMVFVVTNTWLSIFNPPQPPPSPPQRFWKLHPNSTWSPTYQAIKGWISFLPSFQVPRFSPVASQRLVAFHGDFLDFWRKKLPANAWHLPLPSPALTHQEVGSLDL